LEKGNETAKMLKLEKKCDLVVCLSHLGFKYKSATRPDDMKLAKSSEHIDIILGGHTHTFLKKAMEVKNKKGRAVLINQAGWAALLLGRVDVEI
jgi:5'-nucleotidase